MSEAVSAAMRDSIGVALNQIESEENGTM